MTRIITPVCFLCLCAAPLFAFEPVDNPSRACAADFNKFCKGVEAGKGGVIACMKQHQSELSADCKALLERSLKKDAKPAKTGQADKAAAPSKDGDN